MPIDIGAKQTGKLDIGAKQAGGTQRGNIDYDQVRSSARQGSGPLFQMYAGGASPVSGGIPAWDANGNLTISGLNQSTIVSDPTSTKGDLIVRGPSALTRIGAGPDGQVLTADSTQTNGLRWAAVASGGGSVSSVFTRTGAVIAVSGDYNASQVTNAVDQTQTYSNPAWISSLAWSKVTGAPSFMADPTTTKGDLIVHGTTTTRLPVGTDAYALVADSSQTLGIKWGAVVTSAFGRTGAVIGQSGDYTAAQVTNAVSTLGSYTDPAWILSLAWTKIASPPNFVVDPTAIKGDLIVRGSASVPTRIGIGSDGQVLIADSSQTLGMRWGAASGGGSQTPWTQDINAAGYQLLSAGHVGIGTGSPRGMLEVATNAITDTYRGIVDAQYYDGAQSAVLWQIKGRGTLAAPAAIQAGDGLAHIIHAGVTTGGSIVQGATIATVVTSVGTGTMGADLLFSTNSGTSGPSERVRVTGVGNVGIGFTSPLSKLSLGNVANSTNRIALYESSLANDFRGIGMCNPSTGVFGVGIWANKTVSDTNADVFIKDGGSVGIGTASPQVRLSVTGPSAAYGGTGGEGILQITTGSGANTDEKLEFGIVDGSYSWIQALKPGSATRSMAINPGGGNVGIGLVPASALQVLTNPDKTIGIRWHPVVSVSEVGSFNAAISAYNPCAIGGAPILLQACNIGGGIVHYLGSSNSYDSYLNTSGAMYMYVSGTTLYIRYKDGSGTIRTALLTGS